MTSDSKTLAQKSLKVPFRLMKGHTIQFKIDGEEQTIKLKKSTPEEVVNLRKTRKPGIVLKGKNGNLYCAEVPNVNLVPINDDLNVHMCANCTKCCKCDKVHDDSLEGNMREGQKFTIALELSKRIEKYSFIRYGFQIFNASDNDDFTVCKCDDFSSYRQKHQMTLEEIRNAQTLFFDYLFNKD